MFVMIGDPAFCDSPSQTDLSHPVPRFITRDNIRCFHRATTATSSDEYVIGDIHVQADSLGVPVAFLKLKAHHYGRTPSPCAFAQRHEPQSRQEQPAANQLPQLTAHCHGELPPLAAICLGFDPPNQYPA